MLQMRYITPIHGVHDTIYALEQLDRTSRLIKRLVGLIIAIVASLGVVYMIVWSECTMFDQCDLMPSSWNSRVS